MAILAAVGLLTGCAKPDSITRIASPATAIYLTIETANGAGPISADYTKVYVHWEKDGRSDKILVLDGEYLVISQANWIGLNDLDLCMTGGITNTFRNEVNLSIGDDSNSVHTHLRETC